MFFCQLIQKIIGMTEPQAVRENLDDLINITRTLVIDPCGDIQKVACDTLKILCKTYKNLLLHYTQTICKALLLPIISKKSKIRIAALEALNAALECGLWKFNAFVFEDLIGFRDPNSVPIKDFYNVSNIVNSAIDQYQLFGHVNCRSKYPSSIGIYEKSAFLGVCLGRQV